MGIKIDDKAISKQTKKSITEAYEKVREIQKMGANAYDMIHSVQKKNSVLKQSLTHARDMDALKKQVENAQN